MKGMKFDTEKPRWDLLPLETVEEMVEVLTYGANKYEDNNWKHVQSNRYVAALMRHITAYQSGEQNDAESGLHHLAHAMTNVMFLLWLERNKK